MDAIKEKIMEGLQTDIWFTIPIFGEIPVSSSVVITWIIMAVLILLSILLTRRLKIIPSKPQIVLEMFVGFINKFTKETIGEHWRAFAPYFGTIGLYIGLANISGLFGVAPPTKDLNVTAGLALMSMFLIYGASFRYKDVKGALCKFGEPVALIAPLNVMEIVIRPLSLCMRLFGNVLGSFIIMELIKAVVPAVVPIPFSLYFDIFDGIIQTVIFVFLTALFTKEAIE